MAEQNSKINLKVFYEGNYINIQQQEDTIVLGILDVKYLINKLIYLLIENSGCIDD
jgi:hypothetical protein